MKGIIFFIFLSVFIVAGNLSVNAQIAQNGAYKLEQSVIGAGGGTSSSANNQYQIEGTIAEPIAGSVSTAAPFVLRSGFFAEQTLAPTAAGVTVSGRVITAAGKGIRNVVITMTDSNGTSQTAISAASGKFTFANVPSGETYIFSASAKRFIFNQPVQIFSIIEDTENIVFTGESIVLQSQ